MVYLVDRFRADDEDMVRIIPDGASTRVPMLLMDGREQQPGYRASDAASGSDLSDFEAVLRDAQAAARRSRDAYVKRLTDAWRTPPWRPGAPARDAAEPSIHSPPEELLRRHLQPAPLPHSDPGAAMAHHLSGPGPGEGAAAQRERDAAYARYVNKLESAWKTSPKAASAIESELERTRGRGGASPGGR
jgi:hypothetical protein